MALYRPELAVQTGHPGDYTCTFKVAFYVESDPGAVTQVIISRNWSSGNEGIVLYYDNTADQMSVVWFTGGGGTFEQATLASRPAINDQCIGYLQSSASTVKGGWALLSSPTSWVSNSTPNPITGQGTNNWMSLSSNANGAYLTAQNWCGWNELLSESTLSGEIYNAAKYRTNLVFELKLNDGDVTSPWIDTSGNGNNAIQQGGLAPTDRSNFVFDAPVAQSTIAAWPPRNIPLFPPFKRAKSTLWLLDPANWGRASLNVGKWFADEMPTGAASPDVTKALTGVNATGSVGTVVSNVSYAITGNQASGSVGTVKSAVSYALTGNAATGQVGTVVSSITYALSGVQATGSVGTVTVAATDVTLALTGVSATGQVGTLSPNVAYVLTGNQATGQVGTVTSAVSYALTGVAATGNVGAVVSNISYALTGNQATGQVGTVAGVVSFALTGNAATGAVGTVVSNITYGLTGNQATGQVGTVSAGNDVTFALTGVQATGNVGAVTPSITYALTGVQASGQVGTVTASPSYGLTGNQATGQVGTLTSTVAYGLTGVEGTGQVGSVSVPGDVTIALTGVQATGFVGDLLAQIAGNVPAGGSGGYEHEAAIIRYRRAVDHRQREAEIAAKAKAESDEAQQRLNTANTKRQREKESRIIQKLRAQEETARTLEEQLMVEIELLQRAILGANAQQTAMQAEEEEFALMFALTTLI